MESFQSLKTSSNLRGKFLLWRDEAVPIRAWYTFKELNYTEYLAFVFKLRNSIENMYTRPNNVQLFIQAIFVTEDIIECMKKSNISMPVIPPPIEGFEEVYVTMSVMDT